MPWSNPENWLNILGFPFMIREGQSVPKMNKPRAIEGLLITVVGAALSAAAVAAVGYVFLVPEIRQESALLRQTVEIHATMLHSHKEEAKSLREEDRGELRDSISRIEKSLSKIEKKLEKYDNDFYSPINGG